MVLDNNVANSYLLEDQNVESRIRNSVTHSQDMQSKVCYGTYVIINMFL